MWGVLGCGATHTTLRGGRYANRPEVQLVFGCYTIGKERLFMEVARQLDEKVCVVVDGAV